MTESLNYDGETVIHTDAEPPPSRLKIEKPDDAGHVCMTIYGDPGSGKTTFLATAQDCLDTTPMLLVDFEKGTRTLADVDIDITRPDSWKEIQDLYEYLRFENTEYRSVGLDSLTELQKKYSLGTILGDLDDNAVNLESSTAPAIKDWLRTGNQMTKLIRSFRDLCYLKEEDRRIHVFMTALERMNEKRGIICPSLSGALGEECGALIDFLSRLSRINQDGENDGRRYLLTDDHINRDNVKVLGKNRGGKLGSGMWEPSIPKVIEKLRRKGGDND